MIFTPRTVPEIQAELDRIERIEADRNRQLYGPESLHAKGFLSPSCPFCPAKAALRFALGLPSLTNSLMPRETADITRAELEEQQGLARTIERKLERGWVDGAKVNNLYEV